MDENTKKELQSAAFERLISIDENNSIHMKGPVSDIEEINFKI